MTTIEEAKADYARFLRNNFLIVDDTPELAATYYTIRDRELMNREVDVIDSGEGYSKLNFEKYLEASREHYMWQELARKKYDEALARVSDLMKKEN